MAIVKHKGGEDRRGTVQACLLAFSLRFMLCVNSQEQLPHHHRLLAEEVLHMTKRRKNKVKRKKKPKEMGAQGIGPLTEGARSNEVSWGALESESSLHLNIGSVKYHTQSRKRRPNPLV